MRPSRQPDVALAGGATPPAARSRPPDSYGVAAALDACTLAS